MKPIPYCVPDILNLILGTAMMVSEDDFIHRKVLSKVMSEMVAEANLGTTPDEITFSALQSAYRALGVKDPYEKEKARHIRTMLGLEKNFRQLLDAAPDRLTTCLNLVLAGEGCDGVLLGRADAERDILEELGREIARDDREALVKALQRAESVFYILHRAGNCVLDKLLIEELGKNRAVKVAVAQQPILTMATAADAEAAGITEVAAVIDPGEPMLGLRLERASNSFQENFAGADVVIARGEVHFETLIPASREVFCLLQATCPAVAERVGIPQNGRALIRVVARQATGTFEAVGARDTGKLRKS